MNELDSHRPPLPWWAGGILLGLVQVLAIGLVRPLSVSIPFVAADAKVLEHVAPEYTQHHPLISNEEYKRFDYGFWFNIGLVLGAFLTALHLRRWKLSATSLWWRWNHNAPIQLRLITGFCGGVLLLLGAGLAHGCISGQFTGGWAQLSLSAVPFTITMFGFGMLVAYLVYPKAPNLDRWRR